LDENRSKKELMDELIELRTILELKEESLKKIIHNREVLSQTALELVDLPPGVDIYEFIAKKLNNLLENSIIAIMVYNRVSNSFQVRTVQGSQGKLNEFTQKLAGQDLNKIKIPLKSFNQAYPQNLKRMIRSGKLIPIEGGLYQVFGGELPRNLAKTLETAMEIEDVWGTGFKSKGKIQGTVNILLKKGSTLEDEELVQSLINLFAVALQRKKAENDREESEKKYRQIFENVQDVFYQTDINGQIIEISPSIERYSGFSRDYLIGKQVETVYKHPEERKKMLKMIQEKGEASDYEVILENKYGHTVYASVNAHFILDDNNQPIGIEGSLRDIGTRKRAEKDLMAIQHRLRIALDLAKMGSWEYDVESDTFTFDDQFYALYGTTAKAEGGFKMSSKDYSTRFIPPEQSSIVAEEIERVLATDDPNYSHVLEHVIIRVDGEKRFIVVRDGIEKDESGGTVKILGVNQDITELKRTQDEIKRALEEKEMLLKEIHHRVKNNLMVISSLLNLQSRYIKDKEARSIFQESQNRAKSMALIHERLYRSTDLKRIDFGDYIRTLGTDLYHTYVPARNKIKLNMELENLMVDINTTVPLGLIVNELITNSMKHAFLGIDEGEINIEFHKNDNDEFILIVEDNGKGLPAGLDFRNTETLGFQLVNNLTAQIDGNIELDRSHGTRFEITFHEQYQ
jgi:PAS domain S-box-containing protein